MVQLSLNLEIVDKIDTFLRDLLMPFVKEHSKLVTRSLVWAFISSGIIRILGDFYYGEINWKDKYLVIQLLDKFYTGCLLACIHIPLMFWNSRPFSFVLEISKILFGILIYPLIAKMLFKQSFDKYFKSWKN